MPKVISNFTFDYQVAVDKNETTKQVSKDALPVKLFIKGIDQKGNMTIGFNQELDRPDFNSTYFSGREL